MRSLKKKGLRTFEMFISTEAEITTFHLILWWVFQILQYKTSRAH